MSHETASTYIPSTGLPAPVSPKVYITGLAAQYPPYLFRPSDLDTLAAQLHDPSNPGIQRLLHLNRKTGILTLPSVLPSTSFPSPSPPTITELDLTFRHHGTALAVQACHSALAESHHLPSDITHTVAVTCTSTGCPGFDLLVAQTLGLAPTVDRTLLHGVGCAGGLAILRVAAQIVAGATARGGAAVVLAYACELCTPLVRHALVEAARREPGQVGIEGALFSDGAAGVVVCNAMGKGGREAVFEVGAWGTETVPGTVGEMGFFTEGFGYQTTLTRNVPLIARGAMRGMFERLVGEYKSEFGEEVGGSEDFDWALHPGGAAIMDGVRDVMGLSEHQLRASREVYRIKGNSSSPTVLIVLDKLRRMSPGKEHVIATSFGPGVTIEMVVLRKSSGTC
ncbi:Alpha-pyrone synthesis polyketide synthase-like Pks11 [Sphaceloma murrayae]|uniref:Alpha-pyrone synthesis polyketide synthase-like Pks11 n=1 Tax=Sphaceloma murrayae TaxID=2082308 RepID=A0A2K1R1B1_9PEZI|nr:Alpha-pyrone synthesis polyketide synthase-like Pks11 [Sphaceloma murrayae]